MDDLEFEEKLKIKLTLEKIFYSEDNKKKFNLLKGSIDINQKKIIEDLLKKTKYFYEVNGKEYEALKYYIGKVIIILETNRRDILKFISLEDFDSGINEYRRIIGDGAQEYFEAIDKIREKLTELSNKFKNLGKLKKIERGRILEEIDKILTENKNLGNKTDTWKALGISNSDKSMLCKRYNLFKEFKKSKDYSGDEECIKAIEEMTDLNLKRITKEGMTMKEKEEMIVSLIKQERRN